MSNENLPLRHRYATEIAGFRPNLIRRILNKLGMMGKRRNQMHTTSTPNWHFPVEGADEHIVIPNFRRSKKP